MCLLYPVKIFGGPVMQVIYYYYGKYIRTRTEYIWKNDNFPHLH